MVERGGESTGRGILGRNGAFSREKQPVLPSVAVSREGQSGTFGDISGTKRDSFGTNEDAQGTKRDTEETPRQDGLRPRQCRAMNELLAGRGVKQAAVVAGVSRRTVSRWLKTDPYFAAEYNRRLRELEVSTETTLEMLAAHATRCVAVALAEDDRKVALEVLRGQGYLRGRRTQIGSDDAAQIIAHRREAEEVERMFGKQAGR